MIYYIHTFILRGLDYEKNFDFSDTHGDINRCLDIIEKPTV